MKWINGAGARAWLDRKQVAILDRESKRQYLTFKIFVGSLQTQNECVKGTDICEWAVFAMDESVQDVREAIDGVEE